MDNEKLLNELTAKVHNNRGVAERAMELFAWLGLEEHIKAHAEELAEIERDGELEDYFTDLAYDWEERAESACELMATLVALNDENIPAFGYCYLARLMVIYYNNR